MRTTSLMKLNGQRPFQQSLACSWQLYTQCFRYCYSCTLATKKQMKTPSIKQRLIPTNRQLQYRMTCEQTSSLPWKRIQRELLSFVATPKVKTMHFVLQFWWHAPDDIDIGYHRQRSVCFALSIRESRIYIHTPICNICYQVYNTITLRNSPINPYVYPQE